MKKPGRFFCVVLVMLLCIGLVACGSPSGDSGSAESLPDAEVPAAAGTGSADAADAQADYSDVTIRLAQQYGMHYVAAYVMQELGLLEKHLPGVKLEWSQLSGGVALNEALIAGQLDVAFMGIPPMVVAWSQGVDYRIACGISRLPMELMVMDENIQSIEDIKDTDKIAVPGIASIQHIALAMGAEKYLGDAKALDGNIVAMPHPDAYAALVSGTDIAGHFTSTPYIDFETQNGAHTILSDLDTYSTGSSIVCVTTAALHEQKEVYDGLMAALEEAVELINAQNPEALKIVAETENISEEDALRYLTWPSSLYDTKVYGVKGLADFMYEQGFVDKATDDVMDLTWENAVPVDN